MEATSIPQCSPPAGEAALPATRQQWAQSLPKIDLQRHLEGSLRLETLIDIAQEHGIDLPSHDVEGLRPYVQMMDDPRQLDNFLQKFQILRRFYTSKEAVQRIACEAVLDAAADNVRYLELRFNPVALSRVHQFRLHDVVEWVIEAVTQAQHDSGTRTCLIFQIGRHEPLTVAEEIAALALAHLGPLVRGIDLAGDEAMHPAARFEPIFRRAKQAGLNVTVHAGEAVKADGAESIQTAVLYLGAQRIGHGVRAIENSDIVQLLRERRITLEVCPTSNLHTGIVRGLSQHPLYDLFKLGLYVTLNTDDPSISATTLSQEYVVATDEIGLEAHFIYRMLRHSVEAAFIPETERETLRTAFREWLRPFDNAVAAFDTADALPR
jgi:adenosine deaminase